jgi:hypothetical protein
MLRAVAVPDPAERRHHLGFKVGDVENAFCLYPADYAVAGRGKMTALALRFRFGWHGGLPVTLPESLASGFGGVNLVGVPVLSDEKADRNGLRGGIVNSRENGCNLRIATLHCAIVCDPDSQESEITWH